MINYLKLRNPIYQPTAAYGHFGRIPFLYKDRELKRELEFFTWEKTDLAKELSRFLK